MHEDSPDTAKSAADAKNLPTNVRLLGWTSLLNDTASEMIFPLLPQFLLTVLHSTKAQLGIVEGVADSTASLVKLWSGGWSDRAGSRKGFVVFGYALANFVRPLMALVTAPWQVVAIRAGDRFGKGIRSAPRDAMIADSTDPHLRGRAFGFNRAMDHLGAAIGPAIAFGFFWFWPNSIRTLFAITLIPGIIVIALVLFGLREKRFAPAKTERFSLTLRPFDRNFRVYLLALVVFTLGNSSDVFLLQRARDLHVAEYLVPVLWGVFHVVKSASTAIAGRAVDRFGPRPLIFAGWGLYALVYLAFAVATRAWHVWALFLVYGVYYALTEPAEKTLVANIAGPQHKGLAFGWFNFAIGITALPASVIFGVLYDWYGPLASFGWGAGLAALATAMLAMIRPVQSTPQAA